MLRRRDHVRHGAQQRLAGIRQAVQPEGLAANHLQSPTTKTIHRLDHLLSLVLTFDHRERRSASRFGLVHTAVTNATKVTADVTRRRAQAAQDVVTTTLPIAARSARTWR